MPPKPRDPAERFWEKVDKRGPDECWLWTASRSNLGYGQFLFEGKMRRPHRFVYELLVGPIPAGLVIDHLCRTRHCVNPAHLEAVTQRVNTLRGNTLNAMRMAQAQCVNGHPFTPENTYIRPDRGTRECRACLAQRVTMSGLRHKVRRLEEENAALRAEIARLRQQDGTYDEQDSA